MLTDKDIEKMVENTNEHVEYYKLLMRFSFKLVHRFGEFWTDVLDEYGDKTGYYLETLTHSEEPWRIARRRNKCIDKNTMKQFYSSRLNAKKA